MMKILSEKKKLLEAAGLAVAVLGIGARATSALNADSLWLDRTLRHLVSTRSLHGCAVQPAPNTFPDAFVYAPLRLLLGNAHRAHFAFAVCYALLWAWLWRRFRRSERPRYSWGPAALGLGGIVLLSCWEENFVRMFVPGHHGGTALVVFWLATELVRRREFSVRALGVLTVVCLATAMSDRAAIPWLATLVAAANVRGWRSRDAWCLVPFLVGAAAPFLADHLGTILGTVPPPAFAQPVVHVGKLGLWYLLDGWRLLFDRAYAPVIVGVFLEIAVVVGVANLRWRGADERERRLLAASVLGPIASVAAIPHDQQGFDFNSGAIRYLALATLAATAIAGEWVLDAAPGCWIIAAICAQVFIIHPPLRPALRLRPVLSEPLKPCVQELASRGVTDFVGEYWMIWRLEATEVAGKYWASDGGAGTYRWLSPYKMPDRLEFAPGARFAVETTGLDERRIHETFGRETELKRCAGARFLVFTR